MSGTALRGCWLVGLRGAGKTSLGEALAEELGWAFVDLDERIAEREGKPVGQVLQELGVEAFRSLEHRALMAELGGLKLGRRVLALGGGAVENPDVVAVLEELRLQHGYKGVWVQCPLEELELRIERSGGPSVRPRLVGRSLAEECRLLLARRAGHYARLSDLRFDNPGGRLRDLAGALRARLEALASVGAGPPPHPQA
ncbi:MAG: shikimate kinase [Planctomycetota bacterium]